MSEPTEPREPLDLDQLDAGDQWSVDHRLALGAYRQRQLSFDEPELWAPVHPSWLDYPGMHALCDCPAYDPFPPGWDLDL